MNPVALLPSLPTLLGTSVGAILVYVSNLSLEQRKTRNQFLIALSSERVAAYRDLWRQTEAVSFRKGGEIAADIRKSLDEEIKKWYYRNAGAMFLSFQAARCFFEAW